MRNLFITNGQKVPEPRADELSYLPMHNEDGWWLTFVNDEDFAKNKENKLYVRKQRRKQKLSNRWKDS